MNDSFKQYMIRNKALRPNYDEVFGTLRENYGPPQQFEEANDLEQEDEHGE